MLLCSGESSESEDNTGELPSDSGSEQTGVSEQTDEGIFKKPILPASEVLNLSKEKSQILDEIKYHNDEINRVKRTQKLDSVLPENLKGNNSYANFLKQEHAEFFDEDSGNTTQEGLDQLKEYHQEELDSLKCDLIRVESKLSPLNPSPTPNNSEDQDQSGLDKRKRSEFTDMESNPSASKKLRNDRDDNSSGYPSISSDPSSSGSGSGSGSGSASHKFLDSSNHSPPQTAENDSFFKQIS